MELTINKPLVTENAENNFSEVMKPIKVGDLWYKIKRVPVGKDLLKLRRITGFYTLMPKLVELSAKVKADKELSEEYGDLAMFDEATSTLNELNAETLTLLEVNDHLLDMFEKNFDEYLDFFVFSTDEKQWRELAINGVVQVPDVENSIKTMTALAMQLFNCCMVFMAR